MDMRGYVDLLSKQGLLLTVDHEVDCELELGGIARECKSPVLFEKLKGYPGWRIFTNGLREGSLIGLALGLPPGASSKDIAHELKTRKSSLISPSLVATGPVFENVETAGLDLTKLPIPRWNPLDGGRYLGTWHINITKDPTNGSRNVGVYRMELLNPKQATVSTSSNSHLALHVAKAEKLSRPLPMAVAIGVSETTMMAAAASAPGLDEFKLAGGLQTEPLRLAKCKTIDLEVPADSEVVIEGFLKTSERVQDGPYFDYAGTTNTNPSAFLFEATGLMYRNDPIFRGTSIGLPGAEDHQLFAALADVGLVDFHGRSAKQRLQNFLLRRRCFKAFQLIGRLENPLR